MSWARRAGHLLSPFVLALVASGSLRAQSCLVFAVSAGYGFGTQYFPTGAAACAAYVAWQNSLVGLGVSSTSQTQQGCDPSGAPTSAGQSVSVTELCSQPGYTCPSAITTSIGASQAGTGSQCPATCSASAPNQDLLTAIGGSSGYTAGGNVCYNGCEYANGNLSVTFGGASNMLAGKAVPTGNACGTTDATATNGSCVVKGSNTDCVIDSTSTATVNGDEIQPSAPPSSGTCISFASGGVECTVPSPPPTGTTPAPTVPAPPGPDDGTPGVPAAPDATVCTNATPNVCVNYYTPKTVNGSAGPVVTGAGSNGNPLGKNNGTGTGTGSSGDGSGDCVVDPNNPNASCTGTLPSLTRSDTVQSNVQGFVTGLASVPIVAAVTALENAVAGGGSCPTAVWTSTTLAHTFDLMQQTCEIFSANVSTMQLISDAAWALLAALIIMSA